VAIVVGTILNLINQGDASIWIARTNWRQDPAQRTMGHPVRWFT
jgi:hypothetical protein